MFEGFVADLPEVEILRVDVIDRREVSRKIAEDTGVKHESPQALLLGPGQEVLWHASHATIHGRSLAEAAKRAGWS